MRCLQSIDQLAARESQAPHGIWLAVATNLAAFLVILYAAEKLFYAGFEQQAGRNIVFICSVNNPCPVLY